MLQSAADAAEYSRHTVVVYMCQLYVHDCAFVLLEICNSSPVAYASVYLD